MENIIRGNQKSNIILTKVLKKAIMKRSRLKNKANKSKIPGDFLLFKKTA